MTAKTAATAAEALASIDAALAAYRASRPAPVSYPIEGSTIKPQWSDEATCECGRPQ